jgi:hypothetical protein
VRKTDWAVTDACRVLVGKREEDLGVNGPETEWESVASTELVWVRLEKIGLLL